MPYQLARALILVALAVSFSAVVITGWKLTIMTGGYYDAAGRWTSHKVPAHRITANTAM